MFDVQFDIIFKVMFTDVMLGSSSGGRFTLSVLNFFDLYGRYGRFYGVTNRSNRPAPVTDGPF